MLVVHRRRQQYESDTDPQRATIGGVWRHFSCQLAMNEALLAAINRRKADVDARSAIEGSNVTTLCEANCVAALASGQGGAEGFGEPVDLHCCSHCAPDPAVESGYHRRFVDKSPTGFTGLLNQGAMLCVGRKR